MNTPRNKLKMLDLFSGIGGFSLAGRWAGFETEAFCERDPFCREVLKKHWPDTFIFDNIVTMHHFGKVDLITAGFPCQPFSVAGKQKGFADERYLWPDTLRVIKECRPTWVILENVPGIIPHLDSILKDLEREGYAWRAYLIPASAVGAPHKRERIWIVAHAYGIRCHDGSYTWPKRPLQDDRQWDIASIQSEWPQCQPQSWTTFNAQNWLESTTDTNNVECNKRTKNNESIPERSEWPQPSTETIAHDTLFGWEKDQPPIPGVDDGLPNGVDRNKALGNAIVPQVVYPLMKIIYDIEKKNNDRNTKI